MSPFAKTALFAGLVFLIMIWNRFSFDTTEIDIEGWPRVYLFTPAFLLMLYGAVAMERNDVFKAKPFSVLLGDASYSIYLSHILILSACGKIWLYFANETYWDNLFMIFIMIFATLMGGLICYRFIEKPLIKISHGWVQYERK